MKKRLLSAVLAVVMCVGLLPAGALALTPDTTSDYWADHVTVSWKDYDLAPGVTEYEWITNSESLTNQQVSHVMEVDLDQAQIISGYNTYMNGQNEITWGMSKPTDMAQAAEVARNINVVGAVNGDFYNMSNGTPSGWLVMEEKIFKSVGYDDSSRYTFWLDKDNVPHITLSSGVNRDTVKSAVSGGVLLVKDGEVCYQPGVPVGDAYGDTTNPRTMVGYKADGTVVIAMANGRQAPYSVGMLYADQAAMMKALGCVYAINLDGGGSSCFATQRVGEYGANLSEAAVGAGLTMRCRPSDGYERSVANSLLVVSNAAKTGEFEKIVVSPNNEVYTPGSSVQFSATCVDAGGYPVDQAPEYTWAVAEGGEALGSIDASGKFTGTAGAIGTLTVQAKVGGEVKGTATIELQWPDALGFTNSSVSLDYGQTSDLSFNPTYKGQPVNYKDGDFAWSIDESKPLTYKYRHLAETRGWWSVYRTNANNSITDIDQWKTDTAKIYITINGALNVPQTIGWGTGEPPTYYTTFTERSRELTYDVDGTIFVKSTLTHDSAQKVHVKTGTTSDATPEELADSQYVDLETEQFSIGKFAGNKFISDESSSLRATVQVTLKNDSAVASCVEVIVGMEPYVLMDFEGHGGKTAEEYWTYHVGDGELANSSNYLSQNEIENKYKLWYRETSSAGVSAALNKNNTGLSSGEGAKFGEHGFKLGFDFQNAGAATTKATNLGFSADLLLDSVQPTKLGAWVYVPDMGSKEQNEITYGNIILKSFAKAYNNTTRYESSTSYISKIDEVTGAMSYGKGELLGTATYFQFYYNVYDDAGNIVAQYTDLKDMAGKGWIWVETDYSGLTMPINLSRAYTIRIVSSNGSDVDRSNGYKGHIYVDNVQLIYGANTDDVINPLIEEPGLRADGEPVYWTGAADKPTVNSADAGVEFRFSDVVGADQAKYNTGLNQSSVQILLDGTKDITADATVKFAAEGSETAYIGTAVVPIAGLTAGEHTITLTVKDQSGNQSSLTRTFTVDPAVGAPAAVTVTSGDSAVVGSDYTIQFSNSGTAVTKASFTVKLPAGYEYSTAASAGYVLGTESLDSMTNALTIPVTADPDSHAIDNSSIATLTLKVPADAAMGDKLIYSVTAGSYNEDETFTDPGKSIELSAAYDLTCDAATAVKGFETVFTVKDSVSGAAVAGIDIYNGASKIGTTDAQGKFAYTWGSTGPVMIYALNGNDRSWSANLVISAAPETAPAGVQINAPVSGDAATARTIVWFTPVGDSLEDTTAMLKLATKEDMSDAVDKTGTSKVIIANNSTEATAIRVNTVQLTGLEAKTTYYYNADGSTGSFTTGDPAAEEVSFFVMADTQGNYGQSGSLATALPGIKEAGYDFGIHTGDALDNPSQWSQVVDYQALLNAANLGGTPLAHIQGNHEYGAGEVSGAVFGLTGDSWEQGKLYSVEYGDVYVAVINDSLAGLSGLHAALDELVADAQASDAAWKVLAMHKPVFFSESETPAEDADKYFLEKIQEAGIDLVFGGDNHAYVRTYPLTYDAANGITKPEQTETNRDGVVYFIAGDLSSKTNEFHDVPSLYAEAIPKVEYGGAYLSVIATGEEIVVKALDQNGNVLDTYTETKTPCELGKHVVNAEISRYDLSAKTITCSACDQAPLAADTKYTGKLTVTGDSGDEVMLANGVVRTGWLALDEQVLHTDGQGILHETETVDTATCLKNGYIKTTCECGQTNRGAATWSKGHSWDDNHKCTVCNTQGKDISQLTITLKNGTDYSYTGSGIRPESSVRDGAKTLVASSDRYGTDAYISYANNVNVGTATVTYEGRGNYYGSVSVEFRILPQSPKTIRTGTIGINSIQLNWSAAPGAARYQVQQMVGNTWTDVGEPVSGTSYTVTGLTAETQYQFRVQGVSGEYKSTAWSEALTAATIADPAEQSYYYIDSLTYTGESSLKMQAVDGKHYLFLPATAQLNALDLDLAADNKVILKGDLGQVELAVGANADVDLTAIAAADQKGDYQLTMQIEGKKANPLIVMKSSGVAAMYLTSADAAEKGREWVDSSKDNQATGTMQMVKADGTEVYNGALSQIKARGNSTFNYYDKKSYQIKLSTADDLLGNEQANKTWVLLAGYADATQMRDKTMKDLATALGMPYVASSDWVDLYYDGEYRGTYLLSEKVQVGENGVDILDLEQAYEDANANYGTDVSLKTGNNKYGAEYQYTEGLTAPADYSHGWLLERNHGMYDEASGFLTAQGAGFNVKSPEYVDQDAMIYISELYQEFENAVYAADGKNPDTGKYYYEYCDMDSLVQMYLIQWLSSNVDAYTSSLYFYLDAEEGKDPMFYAGPVWDLDLSCGTGWNETISTGREFMNLRYLSEALVEFPEFKEAVKEALKGEFGTMVEGLYGTNGTIAQQEKLLADSVAMNYVLWPYVQVGDPGDSQHLWKTGTTYANVVDKLESWLSGRLREMKIDVGLIVVPVGGGGAVVEPETFGITAAAAQNGTVTVSPDNAAEGDTVTVTVKPAEGYQLQSIAAADKSGKVVTLTRKSDTEYTFTMPASQVEIKAVFEQAAPTVNFTDVPDGEWYTAAVAYTVEKGMFKGTGDGSTFSPKMPTNRAMVWTILARLEGANTEGGTSWYALGQEWAMENGVSDGTNPMGNINREMLAAMLYRYAGSPAMTADQLARLGSYPDGADASTWATDALAWAVDKGIITNADGKLLPQGTADRATAATILMRFCELLDK